ncbi:molybdopterin-dependent oxidoreductase [Geodermatophilus amargosae]|uniref:molybdopterin-dependent oxidoreductase n=1 Tax=Geodermatophilus amargosae TaxID=1296565 RepID=UPI0034DFC1F8
MSVLSRGFGRGRARPADDRLPPGQYDAGRDFPVLSAGPTPHTPLAQWDLAVDDGTDALQRWSWAEFRDLPHEAVTVDIHCVTKWSKFGTRWEGVAVDRLLQDVPTTATHVLATSDGGYTTNVPLADLTGGRAWVVDTYEGEPLAPEHGGPARLLVPHLYFWKSAKWLRRLTLLHHDQPGFWETFGYHLYGDPWREQRYSGD